MFFGVDGSGEVDWDSIFAKFIFNLMKIQWPTIM